MPVLPKKISHFIPATYLLIVLIPLVLLSLLGITFLNEINEREKHYFEQRFLNSSREMVEHEVNSVIAEINEIRDETRNAFERHIKEYLAIAINVAQVEYRNTYQLKPMKSMQQHALDAIAPILGAGNFRSVLVLDKKGDILLNMSSHKGTVDLNHTCLKSALNQSEHPVICDVASDNKTPQRFFVRGFAPLGLSVAIGLNQQQIEDTAKQKSLALIGDTRYGESGLGYVFAYRSDGVFLSHPVSKYVRTNMLDFTDPNGVRIYRELIRKSEHGGGFVKYVWDRYKTGKLVEKETYAKGYPDWKWIIATGFYLDTLFETQSEQDQIMTSTLKRSALYGAMLMLGLFIFSGWLSWLIYRGFNRELSHFDMFFAQDVKQPTPIDVDQIHFREIKQLAMSANSMLEARQKAEEQLTRVFNTIDDVIYVSDPDTYELLFVNSKFERQFGKGFIGQQCYKILQGRETPCEFCTNPKIFGENLGNIYNWEFQNITDKRWYGITDRAIQWHDGRMVRFEHARDITEQKLAEIERENYQARLEQAVEQRTHELQIKTDQLEQANKDLEGFSYSVSHDLRSPLRAIDGFLSILREDYMHNLDEEGIRLFGIVQDNARKMGVLIDDILAFSRAGRLELERQPLDMNLLANTIWNEIRSQHTDRNIQFSCQQLPPVEADPHAIRQVLYNLITNAVKFSARSDPSVIEVKGEAIDGYVRYSVSDNGVGFSEEYKDKLFVMFQRLHGMDEFDGTGIGLAIIKRFVQKHGGRVDAQSTPGEGATFSFDLPS